jgi:hypothetical protein
MDEACDAMLSSALQQHMCPVDIRVGKLVRVAKAEINVGLRREMEDGVDVMLAQYALHVCRRCNVAVLEGEVPLLFKCPRIIQCRAVVELIEGDDIIVVRIREDEMANNPTGSAHGSIELL